ncbi:hypothetical protein HKD37_11G031820 [Glycine soja]
MHQQFGYTVSYKKAWTTKQKALEMTFGSWEQSYSYLPIWLTSAQHFVPDTIVKYKTLSSMEEGDDDPPRVILSRVFWVFNPYIEDFKYCKPLVQIDGTFLTGKYRGTLLTVIRQDGSRNNFPRAFAIVESETKEAWMGFLHYLRRYVTPQPNLGYEMRKSRFEAKFLTMRAEFPQAAYWLDQIPKSKWTQTYDEGKWYDHMTTNLAECMNSVLKGARALPITALVNETFNKINDSFVTNDIKIMNMIKAGHRYSEDVYVMMQENQHIVTSHYVCMYARETGEFEFQEIINTRLGRRAMACTVRLNEWSCDCG